MIKKCIIDFIDQVRSGNIEIYNEFSLQHELGCFLRKCLKDYDYKVQFERNVSYFGLNKNNFIKKEIDISIFKIEKNNFSLGAAIELKFPRNGQYPEQMFSFCKDIKFAEQLKNAGFNKAFVIIFADDPLFYQGNSDGIYGFFRSQRPLERTIEKPTGKEEQKLYLKLNGSYKVKWRDLKDRLKYTIIEAQ